MGASIIAHPCLVAPMLGGAGSRPGPPLARHHRCRAAPFRIAGLPRRRPHVPRDRHLGRPRRGLRAGGRHSGRPRRWPSAAAWLYWLVGGVGLAARGGQPAGGHLPRLRPRPRMAGRRHRARGGRAAAAQPVCLGLRARLRRLPRLASPAALGPAPATPPRHLGPRASRPRRRLSCRACLAASLAVPPCRRPGSPRCARISSARPCRGPADGTFDTDAALAALAAEGRTPRRARRTG